jgi:hypothetical protein
MLWAVGPRYYQRSLWLHDRRLRLDIGDSTPTESAKFSKFFELPLELREKIYTFAINDEYESTEVPIYSRCRPTTVLSLVNGQVHDEVCFSH